MLTPERLSGISDDVVKVFAQAEQDITDDIARRIVKTDYMTDTAAWQLDKAKQIGMLQGDVAATLAAATGKSHAELSRIMTDAGVETLKSDASIYESVGKTPTLLTHSRQMTGILKQGIDSTGKLVGNFSKTTVVSSVSAFTNAVDTAYIKSVSGAFTVDQSIRKAVNDLARQGITSVTYAGGGSASIETAVDRAVRTGVSQTCAKLQLALMDEMGTDLVETTSHAGARPSHQDWQGEIFSREGLNNEYRDFSATGYGSGDGLCGWNCRHSFYPYIEGASMPSFKKYPSGSASAETDLYNDTQMLRAVESKIRNAKRGLSTYESAQSAAVENGNTSLAADFADDIARQKKRIAKLQAKARKIVDEKGLVRDYNREQVGKSTASKTAAKADDAVKYTSKQLDDMTLEQLQTIARDVATQYYKSGASGINFGKRNIDDVVNSLIKGANKTSLKKDILSIQKKVGKTPPT